MQTLGSKNEERKLHKCDVGDMHPTAVAILAETLDRILQSTTGGCLGAQTDWFENECVPLPYVCRDIL